MELGATEELDSMGEATSERTCQVCTVAALAIGLY